MTKGKRSMKFRAHETFSIRKGWLSKGMKQVVKDPSVFVSKEYNPMDVLGIGSNMVKSLRYSLPAVALSESPKGKSAQYLTEFGEIVYKNDPYIEEIGTLWLLHYNLVKQQDVATSWFFFFNHFQLSEFSKEDFTIALANYAKMNGGGEPPVRSLDDDFNCIINTYHCFQKNPALLKTLKAWNVPMQINAYSLVEEKNESTKELARMLLKNKLVTFVGSDAHRTTHRPPNIKSGVDYIYQNCDGQYADDICFRNAERYLLGADK